jgi:hypothetical protein
MIALFVSLSGASYAAIKANSIGAKQLKNNSVRAGEIQDGAVGSAEIGDNAVGSGEVANNAVGSGEVADNAITGSELQDGSVGSGDVGDGALTGGDLQDGSVGGDDVDGLGGADVTDGALTGADVGDGSLGTADLANLDNSVMGIGESVSAFGRVRADGTLLPAVDPSLPSWAEGIDESDISQPGGTDGVYCFDNLDFRPTTGMVALDNAGFATSADDNSFAVSLAIERGNNIAPCANGSDARVITTRIDDAGPAVNVDHPFIIWFIR